MMSFLHSTERIETETLPFKTEIIQEENGEGIDENNITLNQIEYVKEEFEEGNKNLKVEDEIFLKEEIKEFIDDQFDPKYDRCIDKFQYISSLCDKTNDLKKIPKEESEEVKKTVEAVHSIHCGNSEDIPCGNKECRMDYSDWKQGVIKEEFKFEEHSLITESPVFSLSTDGLHEEKVDFEKEHMVHESTLSREPSTVKLSCSDCSLQFKPTHDLKFHTLKEDNKQLDHHCTICEDSFKVKQDLEQHNCHDKNLDAKEKEYTCSECPETFRFQKELSSHLKVFHNPDKLRCCYCPLAFDKKSALKSHMSSHKGVFKHNCVCEVCGRVFNFQSNLVRHMKIHSGHKPYCCETCGKEFSRLDHLKVHKLMRKHQDLVRESSHMGSETHLEETLDIEEFVCEICGLGFRIKQRLRDHLKLHTENRPHTCKVCNRAFKQIYNLKQHLLSHDGPRDFICDICNKGFKRKAFLKQHMLVHTKEKKYICEICGKRYYKSCHVTAHKKKAHNSLNLHQEIESTTKKRRPISRKIAVTCDTCNRVFQHKNALAQHVLTHLE